MPANSMPKRMSSFQKWLHGDIGHEPEEVQKNIHKISYRAEVIPQKQIAVLVFGCVVAYCILVVCGRMGSPDPVKINMVECGVHNMCSISSRDEFQSDNYRDWMSVLP